MPRDLAKSLEWYRKAEENGHVGAMMALARLLSTLPEGEMRNAVETLKWANELYGSQVQIPESIRQSTFACAVAELGRFDEAIEFQRLALNAVTADTNSSTTLLTLYKSRLASFENHKASREPLP